MDSQDSCVSERPVIVNKARALYKETEDEALPSYAEQFEKDARHDMILLGSLSLEQGKRHEEESSQKKTDILQKEINLALKKAERQLLKAASARQAEMTAKYGDLQEVEPASNGRKVPSWKVRASKQRTPIRLQMSTE
ncbi:hypothetical protein NDU88_004418 [Pleurodeles waltl]|uniref:Uncharacterized protein n=1 Tax=Pleurodeles waltl TaxID=8319 RepID=A0AAV7VK79_PLEWA|nr:hypothetical protein NDU88_004418 [Pleurodeles waltl]